jgi:deazaflavin-dependent oxidoreductase (nitroreductase family)
MMGAVNVKDTLGKAVNVLHRTVYSVSGGRIGGSGLGMPVVILTTIGRKSGQPRSTMLTAPIEEDDRVVVVASWGGDDRNPQWYLNLQANPDVELTLRNKTRKMRARVASSEERSELWPRVTKDHANYAGYQRRTEREIPLVILEPA